MSALTNLTDGIAKLNANIDLLIAKPAGIPEADVQAAADAVEAVNAKVETALSSTA